MLLSAVADEPANSEATSMSRPANCPGCGSALPPDAPGGLCPRCLLRQALEAGGTEPPAAEATESFGPGFGGVPTRWAETCCGLPRILLRDADSDAGPPVPQAEPDSPERLTPPGRYQLAGEIARGGMGAVLRARDPDLGRDLAVKVLLERHKDKPELVRRFLEEAQIAGQLQHPGVVPVYDLGAFADRRPFFAMKLVRGRTLAALLRDRPGPAADLPRFLGIFEQVCQTVAYAHARGVIHRDLKPANVMVGGFGEVQLMDWGLAKVLPRDGASDDAAAGRPPEPETVIATARRGEPDAAWSRAGSVMGTPAYMAPEQARGEVDRVDERADVFALGSILCEILTGQPTFIGRTPAEIQRRAARGETADALARLDACGADAELVGLARACLAAEPEDRLRDAGAVSARIVAYLAGVQERLRAAERERAVAEARAAEERKRRKLQVGLAAAILALTTLGVLASTYALHQRQARAARVGRLLAEATLLRDQAGEQPDDIGRWERAREALARIADDLGTGAGLAERAPVEALRREVAAGLEAAEADRKLLERLVDVRSAAADDPDGSTTDAAYAMAFGQAGIDPITDDPAEVGARVARHPEAVARASVAALDHWTALRHQRDAKGPGWARLLAAARAADPDPDRDALRAALLVDDKPERLRRLRPLAGRADAEAWASASLVLLGGALADAGDVEAGVAVLRRASGAHPADAPIHYALALQLERMQPPGLEEALRALAVARALQPELAGHELAHALERHGSDPEAEAVWRDLIDRRPDNGRHLGCYGSYLVERDRDAEAAPVLDRAVATLHEAIRLRPDDAVAHHNLGLALASLGKYGEATAEYREAIRLRPDDAVIHTNLGNALGGQGKYGEAISAHREAIRLRPDDAVAHYNLGLTLRAQGKQAEAIAEFREAIRLKPDYADAHINLGAVLCDVVRDYPAAEAAFREAVRLRPDDATPHYNLGNALKGQEGKQAEAIAEFREAIRLKPDYADAHINLGIVLGQTEDFAGALAALRRGHEMGSKRPGWTSPSAEWVRQAERQAALAERFPAVLSGAAVPADTAERLDLARMSYDTKRYAAAARLWAQALEADPALADDVRSGHRYNAACAAALAGCGRGRDDPPPDDVSRAALRQRALAWLRADLALRSKPLDHGTEAERQEARQALRHWKSDPDLAGVRDRDALAALPEPERAGWQALWAEVDRLLQESGKAP